MLPDVPEPSTGATVENQGDQELKVETSDESSTQNEVRVPENRATVTPDTGAHI